MFHAIGTTFWASALSSVEFGELQAVREGPLPSPDHRQCNYDHPIAPNLLARVPKTTGPNQIWVADITCNLTDEGWLYIAGVLDLHSRKIVGWAMSQTIDSALVLAALAMASLHRTCHLDCFSIPTGVFNTLPVWSHP